MEEDDYYVIEWTIVNFSYWNREMHGKVIRSPNFPLAGRTSLYLYPRDFNGRGENLVVELNVPGHGVELADDVVGDLSLISSNGSKICCQRGNGTTGFTLKLPCLEFSHLVAQIKKNEADYQDQLSVRCRLTTIGRKVRRWWPHKDPHIRTTIEAHEVSVKIPSEIFEELIEDELFPVIRIPLKGDDYNSVQIDVCKREESYSSLIRVNRKSVGKLLVSTRSSVLNKDDAVLKTLEDYKHIFYYDDEKDLNSLRIEEVNEKHCSLFIRIKIILPRMTSSGEFFKGLLSIGKGIYVMPPNFLNSHSFSQTDGGSSSNSKVITPSHCPDNAVTVLSKELMCLFQDQDFSDLQLNCRGVSLPVHRAILSARSPVFKRLLSSDMKEATSGAVDIEDLDAATLARFIAFLYTGTVEDLDGDSALKLYYAADKYEVPSLKTECVSGLCTSVSVANVSAILSLADKHQDDQVMSFAVDFILRNFNEVMGSSEWESFVNQEPLLVAKTLTAFARKKSLVRASTY